MIVIGLDKKQYKLKFNHPERQCSKQHERCRVLLKELFPFDVISEEVLIPGTGKKKLYIDFWINSLRIAIEVHGEQHYSHVQFFHKTKLDFLKAKTRDNKKKEWCELNEFIYLSLDHKETDNEWRTKILCAIKT